MKKIESFNELRAISAAIVVFSHIGCTNKLLGGNPGGFSVCIFFLLSGFLTVFSTMDKNKKFFLIKRYLKIAPLYYVMTIFCFVVAVLKPSLFNTTEPSALNLIRSILFIPYVNKNGISRPILDVGWYVNVLFFFYVIFKIAMLISHKYRALLSTITLVSICTVGEIFFTNNPIFVLYRNGLFCISAGMVIASIYVSLKQKENFINKRSVVFNFIMYALYLFTIVFLWTMKLNVYLKLLIPVLFFVLVLCFDNVFVSTKINRFISMISMSLYLTHEIVVKGVSRLIYNLDNLNIASFLVGIMCFCVAIAVATPVYILFEKKMSGFLISKLSGDKNG